jgi:hypothetical protein
MLNDDHPFMTAQGLMEEAANWAKDLTLPVGDPARHEDDTQACVEQVAVHLVRAADLLIENGSDLKQVDEEIIDGQSVPVVDRDIHDPTMVDAGKAVEELARPFGAWDRGGEPVEVTEALLASIRELLPARFGERLAADREAYERGADDCPF